tara:strand:+ start:367 stop:1383 length:1017 start_codon:yes stop_codon:yes gene_type:complete
LSLEISVSQNNWLLKSFKESGFGNITSTSQLRIESSQREFFRVKSIKRSLILMVVPAGIDESVSLFVTIGRFLKKNKVNVPEIFAYDENLGLILVEDFGDNLYQFNLDNSPDLYYEQAINELIKIQSSNKDDIFLKSLNEEIFDMNWELFEKDFYRNFLALSDEKLLHKIKKNYNFVCSQLENQPKVVCHYDYECRNLIFTSSKKAGILDFQDALIGPIGLDLASLFKDLYYEWPEEKIHNWYKIYISKIKKKLGLELSLELLVKFVDFASIQRQIRILGKLSQVYQQLSREERIKDFPRLIDYLVETSSRYVELENLSFAISSLREPLENKMDKIFS